MTDADPAADGGEAEGGPLSAAADLARAGIEQARQKAGDLVAATREKSEAVIAATLEKGEAVIDDTRDKTLRAAAETNRLFNEHPIAAVAAAAAAGAVIGIFVPRLAMTGRFGKLAGKAIRAAAANELAHKLLPAGVGALLAGRPSRPVAKKPAPPPAPRLPAPAELSEEEAAAAAPAAPAPAKPRAAKSRN